MNEKIKQLISQSYEATTVTTIDPFTSEVVVDFIDGTKPFFNQEKFAELIVRECCEQSMSIGRYNTPSGVTPDLAIAISVGLKKHFGVEELQQPIDFETQDPETAKGTKVEHFGVKE
jgi:hypothetical protein